MADVDKTVALHVEMDTTGAQAGVAQYKQATTQALSATTEQIGRVNASMLQMGVRFQETGIISTRQLAAIGVSLKEIERNTQSLSATEREWLAAAQKGYKDAIQSAKEYNEQLQQVQRQTRDWTGFQSALGSLGGTFGQLARDSFAFGAALTAGWEAGRKLDEDFLSKLPNWKRSWDELAQSVFGYSQKVKEAAELANDPNFAGTRTLALLPQIVARMGNAAASAATPTGEDPWDFMGRQWLQHVIAERKRQQEEFARQLAQQEATFRKKIGDIIAGKGDEFYRDYPGGFSQFVQLQGVPVNSLGVLGSQATGQGAMDEFMARLGELQAQNDEEMRKRWLKAAQDAGDEFNRAVEDFAKTFADDLTELLDPAGQSFGEIAARHFKQGVNDALKDIGKQIGGMFAGTARVGDPMPGGGFFTSQSQVDAFNAQQGNNAIGAAGAALNFGAGIYTAASQRGSALSNIISLGSTGYQAGTMLAAAGIGGAYAGPIGLAVGVIAGAVISIINDQILPAVQKYAVPGISQGLATLNWQAGFNDAESKDWLAKIQKSFDTFKNGFAKIILALPDDLQANVMPEFAKAMAQLGSSSFNYTAGVFQGSGARIPISGSGTADDPYVFGNPTSSGPTGGSRFQPSYGQPPGSTMFPSWNPDAENPTTPAEWQNWMNLWINQQLPQAEMEVFKNTFQIVFRNIGFTAARFQELWKTLEGMDPKDALNAIGNLVTAFSEIREAMRYFETSFSGGGGLLAQGFAANNQSFAQQLEEMDAQIIKFGNNLKYLVGQDQIDAAKQLGDMMKARQDAEKQFFQQLAAQIQSIRLSFGAMIRDLELQNIPTNQGKIGYLTGQANDLLEMIRHAPTGEMASQFGSQYAQIIQQMVQIGGNTEEWRKWAADQLKKGEDEIIKRMNDLGKAVEDQNKRFNDAIEGFIDAFLRATGQIDPEAPGSQTNPRTPDPNDPWAWMAGGGGGYGGPVVNRNVPPRGGGDGGQDANLNARVDIYVNGEYAGSTGFERRTMVARGRAA